MTGRIVLLGGYGAVGRAAAAALTGRWPGEIVVAGRDPAKARSVPGTVPLRVDLRVTADIARAVTGAHAVIMCAEQSNARVAGACLDRGVHYLDVSASAERLARIERLRGRRSATAVLSVGLAPGVTNLLARHCVDVAPPAPQLRIGVLIGGGERHGAAAVDWTLDGLGETGPSWRMRFPEPFGTRVARRFPFSDQYTLPATLGVERVATGLCLDSRSLSGLLGAPGVARLLRRPRLRLLARDLLGRVHVGSDAFAVTVSYGAVSASFSGRRQSRATGLVAALLATRLDALPRGVHHIEEVVEPGPFLDELAAEGFTWRPPEYDQR